MNKNIIVSLLLILTPISSKANSLLDSIIIGDRLTDLISGLNAGIRNLIHIKTGYGISERKKIQMYFDNLDENVKKPFYINNFSDESLKFIEKFFKS